MTTIKIYPLMEGRTYPDAGDLLYSTIIPMIDSGEDIELDMAGVDALPTMFLNVSLGRIAKEKGKNVAMRIPFRNIPKSQTERLEKYFSVIQ